MLSIGSLFGEESSVFRDKNFQLLMLVGMIHPLGTGVVSPILESLIGPFDASAANIGWMISVFLLPAIIVIPIVGALADHYGRKRLLTASLALFGAAGTAIGFTTDFYVALTLRLIQGVGWAGLVPLVVTSIGDLYQGSAETTIQGFRQAGSSLVGGTLSIVAGVVVVIAWQYPFFVYILALPGAVMVYLWFDEPTAGEGATADDGDTGQYWRALFGLLRRSRVLAIVIGRIVPFAVFAGFGAYNSIFVVELLDGTPALAGVLYAVMSLALSITATQAGRVETLFGTWDLPLLGANVCMGLGFGLIVFAPHIVVAGGGAMLIGVGIGIAGPLYRNLITGFAPAAYRGGLVSVGAAGSRLMGAITPVAMGAIIARGTSLIGFAPAIQLASVAVILVGPGGGVICVLVAKLSPPVEDPEAPVDHS